MEVLDVVAARFGDRPVPDDLRALVALPPGRDSLFNYMGFKFVGPDDLLYTHSYLTDADRADPGIMANVAAIDGVLSHAFMVARDGNSDYYGYWLHPDEPAVGAPAVVCLDSEGQFCICRGSLIEAMINGCTSGDQKFARLAQRFADAGVPITTRRRDDLAEPTVVTDPGEVHGLLYQAERAKRGLPGF